MEGRFGWDPPAAQLGGQNALLRARSRNHFVKDFPGPLSIKCVTSGTVTWKCGGRELVVDRDAFLVLNDGEPYSMNIDERAPVETLCLFFQRGFVESVHASVARAGIEPDAVPAPFPRRLYARNDHVVPRLLELRGGSRLGLDQQCLQIACDLLALNEEVARRIRGMPARRAATRDELFRRVRRGQEFLHASFGDDLNLAELAREACLSPYHFHRAFLQAFGRTPHRYRTELRLARARRLLETTLMTVTEICGAVGFESGASFSALFRQRFGVPPSGVRKAAS